MTGATDEYTRHSVHATQPYTGAAADITPAPDHVSVTGAATQWMKEKNFATLSGVAMATKQDVYSNSSDDFAIVQV